jgi:hypothetical protein
MHPYEKISIGRPNDDLDGLNRRIATLEGLLSSLYGQDVTVQTPLGSRRMTILGQEIGLGVGQDMDIRIHNVKIIGTVPAGETWLEAIDFVEFYIRGGQLLDTTPDNVGEVRRVNIIGRIEADTNSSPPIIVDPVEEE